MKSLALILFVLLSALAQKRPGYTDTPVIQEQKWRVHDSERPYPAVVTPGATTAEAPSDAVVLFDGKDLAQWVHHENGRDVPAKWTLGNGYFEVAPKAGELFTKQKFGDCQLHIEWMAPAVVKGEGQSRGNSGIYLMSRYEIQVLDSYENPTYADGQAGAIYGQWPPLVNASKKPGEWQTYDIIFEAPAFDAEGKVTKPAFATVIHNGVLLHHRKRMNGPMKHREITFYTPHEAAEPLGLQDHGDLVRYRNIWIRPLKPYDAVKNAKGF